VPDKSRIDPGLSSHNPASRPTRNSKRYKKYKKPKHFANFVKKRNNMNTIELKKNFHILIDSIDNENLLISFYDLIKKRSSTKEGQLWCRLTKAEQEELLMAFEESDNPENLISHDEMVTKHKKWL
jgi:hypothetical protein